MNTHIGFADAVREAQKFGSDNWIEHGYWMVRRTEPFNPEQTRGDRFFAMTKAADHPTSDQKEFLNMKWLNERIKVQIAREAVGRAKQLRLEDHARIRP